MTAAGAAAVGVAPVDDGRLRVDLTPWARARRRAVNGASRPVGAGSGESRQTERTPAVQHRRWELVNMPQCGRSYRPKAVTGRRTWSTSNNLLDASWGDAWITCRARPAKRGLASSQTCRSPR